jgi:asparagine synthase (glutamine-hydrolysing)
LDSSLVAAIVARHAERRVEEMEKTRAWWPRVHSFSIGLKGAPDLPFAKQVADYLSTVHHEFHFTVEEGIDAVPQVIWHLETYDVTTIRASTPMFLLARRIKAMGIKMVLSGEGSDEIFGGYLYFHNAPNATEFHKETVRRVKNLHLSDCLRANKSTMAWGLEVRVPFLDKDFLELAMTLDPNEKLCSKQHMEKYVLRKAFDTPAHPYLPESILWRQKEQFSDGVGYGWINSLKALAEKEVSDADFAAAATTFPVDPPATKEAYMYRRLFAARFPHPSATASVKTWVPTWGASKDPSGRAQAVHLQALQH